MDDKKEDRFKIPVISDQEIKEKLAGMFVDIDIPESVKKVKKPIVYGDVVIPPNVVNMNAFSRYNKVTNTRMEEELAEITERVKERDIKEKESTKDVKEKDGSLIDDEKIRTKFKL